jgi:UDP-N-acetylglucosamine--dolichyl-phosphate N-acetylglucosaminephosphotransferase
MPHNRRFDPETNLLFPSKTMFLKAPSQLTVFVLRTFAALGLTELTTHSTNGSILESSNLTILNFFLVRFGPMNEKKLVKVLIWSQVSTGDSCPGAAVLIFLQIAGSVLAFVIRYGLAGLVYDGDRR